MALLVFVCIHEMGHVLAARLCGYPQARFDLWKKQEGKWIWAVTYAPLNKFTDGQNVWISLAGVLLTRLCAEGMLVFSGVHVLQGLEPLWIALFLLLRTDFALYVLRNALGFYLLKTPQGDQDITLAAQFLQKTTRRPEGFWFSIMGMLAVLDVWLGASRAMDFVLLLA